MFCTHYTLEYNSTSVYSILNPCIVEFIIVVCFSLYIYVFILLLIYLRWSPNIHPGVVVHNKLFIGHNTRNGLMLLLVLVNVVEFGECFFISGKIWYVKLIPTSALVATIICQIFYSKLEEYGKYHFLIITVVYWISYGFCQCLKFLMNAELDLDFSHVRVSTSTTTCILCFCLIVCDLIALLKEIRKRKFLHTTNNADESKYSYKHSFCNWYSRLTFHWLTPILHLGYITSLHPAQFGHIPKSETSSIQFSKLEHMYSKNENAGLAKCFTKIHWRTFMFGGLLKLLGDLIGFLPPLGISVVVKFIETKQSNESSGIQVSEKNFVRWPEFISNGYIIAVIVFVAILAQGTLSQNSTHIVNVEGIRLKNALQGLIYRKLLRIRRHAPSAISNCDNTGYITNLITEDSYNIMSCFWLGNYIWAIPLKILLLIYLLHQEIGVSAVVGSVACIIIMLLLQLLIGKKMSKNYKSISDCCDKRLRRINEVLQGIKFIKLCGWELDFIEEVSKLRGNELKHLNLDSIYWACITFLANTSSIILTVVILTLHYLVEETRISLSSLFTSFALFNQLTVPLFIFPIMVPIVLSATVSLKRIEQFLALSEIEIPAQKTNGEKPKKSHFKINVGKRSSSSLRKHDGSEEQGTRLRKITENSETEDDSKTKHSDRMNGNEILKINKIRCSWNDLSDVFLQVGCISILTGSLNVIIGGKGSGKTSLLSATLGEMTRISGTIEWKKCLRIGYVPESAWLLDDTIKKNILFGYPFQEKHFARVVQMCALRSDINAMPNKEHTMTGDRGLMLSGGQKKRIMIARMLYSRPDVVIMDEPFSSLDSKTTNYIFENTIRKFLLKQNKTVIMTTNCKKFLTEADQVIVMEGLKLKISGRFSSISKVALEEIQSLEESTEDRPKVRHSVREDLQSSSNRSQKSSEFIPLTRCRSALSGSRYFTHDLLLPTDDCDVGPTTVLHKQKRLRAATMTECPLSPSSHQNVFRVSSLQPNYIRQGVKKKRRFDLEEEILAKRHQSTFSDFGDDWEESNEPFPDMLHDVYPVWDASEMSNQSSKNGSKIYIMYIRYCGVLTVFLYFLLTFGWQIIRIMTEFWLSSVISSFNVSSLSLPEKEVHSYLYLYIILSIIALLLALCSTAAGQYAGSMSRKLIHHKILHNVMMCPVEFFDTTSIGQIINRFSTDIEIIDKKIPTSTQRLIQFQLLCLSAILLNCLITPWFVVLAIPIALVYYKIQMFYRRSSRELQHLENLLKAPVINHFFETFNGLEVIRALEQQNTFQKILFHKMDAHTNIFLISNASNRWLGTMLDYLGGVIVFAAMIVSLITVSLQPSFKTSTFFGLAINYTLLIPIYLTWVVKFLIDLDIYMGAVNRVQCFSKLPIESYKSEMSVPKDWPNQGCIQFTNVTLRYSEQGPAVIRNLNLCIKPRQKVGICGRTGSGKSSLMMSLFRMIPCIEGNITLDGVDTTLVPLQDLRSKISIVPQDVILFSGNIRQTLDLKQEFTDQKLWESLRLVRMDETVAKLGGLDAVVHDGGSNLSAGEKQLICLARAILRDSCCLILDEATNTLQPEAEMEFLNLILKIFHNITIVVVTHRVTSMLDFDRILLLDNGIPVEDGSPRELMALPNSRFFSLLRTAQELSSEKPRFYF